MEQIKQKIIYTLQQILEQKSCGITEIDNEMNLIEDLGLSSLDIAQLIATLEIELGVDPFTAGTSISAIRTVKSLCEIYQKYLEMEHTETAQNQN